MSSLKANEAARAKSVLALAEEYTTAGYGALPDADWEELLNIAAALDGENPACEFQKTLKSAFNSLKNAQAKNTELRNLLKTESLESRAAADYYRQAVELMRSNPISASPVVDRTGMLVTDGVLIVQLSDLHFNEVVKLKNKNYNFHLAAARLAQLAAKAKSLALATGAQKIIVAASGDLMNSDRRADEYLTNEFPKPAGVQLAVRILVQFYLDLASVAQVEVYSITGNESRNTPEQSWATKAASNSADFSIYENCKYKLEDHRRVSFVAYDANEICFTAFNRRILMLHGHQIRSLESGIGQIYSKYAKEGTPLDYVLFGHIHSSYIGDFHARNSSLVGSNSYSYSGLNLASKAAQNIIHISKTGIDGLRVDLENLNPEVIPYDIEETYRRFRNEFH